MLTVLIIGILYSILFLVFQNINKRKRTLEMQLDILNKEIAYLELENQNLKKGILDSSKSEELEKEIRMNYGYKKEGETAVMLSPTTTKDDTNTDSKTINF
ncbi:MAG TPA: septum formation initiator family protein [Candidatus Paceibacterota bacterium]|nr:septum formation initiator family protein [Candidatus Paceibacterota bacterium]HRZ29691.1 septum formation initiator family protein [Candidatus Paceibacterota bacterium]